MRCDIPVVCRINQTVRCTHISSNTTMYQVVCYLLYVKHNYMFRPQILAIIRLYNENLSIRYTCIYMGCIECRVGSGNADNGQYFSLVLVYIFCRRDNGQLIQLVHNVQSKTVYFTLSLLDLAHRILYTTTLTIGTYCYVSHSRHSYKQAQFSVQMRFLTSPKPSPPHPPHLRDLALTFPTLHTIHTLQMHVYLIDKFSLYKLMMAKICGRNMQLCFTYSKQHTTKYIVVFDDICVHLTVHNQ